MTFKKILKFIDNLYSWEYYYTSVFLGLILLWAGAIYSFKNNPNGIGISTLIFLSLMCIHLAITIIRILIHGLSSLLNKKLTIPQIIIIYIGITLTVIALFSMTYGITQAFGWGALVCNSAQCVINPSISYIYFSGITYFTVGYGDIIPTGVNQIISVINAFVGNLFTVIIIAFAINNIKHKNGGRRKRS